MKVIMIPIMSERIQKGIKFKFLLPENRLSANESPPEMAKNLEVKGLSDLPAIVVLTEKEADVAFRQIGGRMDYASFFVKDRFQYYWDKGKRP